MSSMIRHRSAEPVLVDERDRVGHVAGRAAALEDATRDAESELLANEVGLLGVVEWIAGPEWWELVAERAGNLFSPSRRSGGVASF